MYENPDENRQIHAKFVPIFKIWRIYAWQITIFSWFREFAPPFEKNTPPPPPEMGTKGIF